MNTVLLTGFEPFGGEQMNPSALAAEELDGRVFEGHRIVSAVLPCAFGAAIATLKQQLSAVKPELVICLGQAEGRAEISLERVAINLDDACIPDNLGAQPIDQPISNRGPAAYWSTLPIKSVVSALSQAGIPAGISHSAGTFVCNHVFYGLMRTLSRRSGIRGGFIHVPIVPEQLKTVPEALRPPSLPLNEIVNGLEVVIRTALSVETDEERVPEGGLS